MLTTYRTPIIVTILMVSALFLWAWHRWSDINQTFDRLAHQRVMGLVDAMDGAFAALAEYRPENREQANKLLKSFISASPISFVELRQGDKPIFSAGGGPRPQSLPTPEGDMTVDGRLLIWRRLHLPGHDPAGQTLLVGFRPPPERPGHPRAITALFITVTIALCFIVASLAAWVMAIRGALLAEQLKAERARREHLEDLGLAAAGLAHETKNPLGVILGLAQQIADQPDQPAQSRQTLIDIIDEADKASARLGGFMTFASRRQPNIAPVDLAALAEKVTQLIKPDLEAAGVVTRIDCPPWPILADEEMLRQVLVNLLLNSLRASSAGGEISIALVRQGETATLLVRDRGAGVPPDLLPKIFKPYVSGDATGHGLGLAIVKRFVEEHGWSVAMESQPGQGATVTIQGVKPAPGRGEGQ